MSAKLTRRRFLEAAGAGAAWIVLANTLGCEPSERSLKTIPESALKTTTSPAISLRNQEGEQGRRPAPRGVSTFRSRPDLRPSTVEVSTRADGTAPGYVFVAPKEGAGQYGPMIVDNHGRLVWFRPVQNKGDYAMDFKVQRYKGEPVLTWAEGRVVNGHGHDEYVILDRSYREIKRLRAGGGYWGDHHEFLITPKDTALITVYDKVNIDLTPIGGPKDGAVYEGIFQELNIETGEVLFEWHSLDHVGIEESYGKPYEDSPHPFDYFHINSIDIDHDDNLLVSARRTFTVYKIDRKSGEIIWRLGGKNSDFEMGPGTRTAYQHDARRQPDGTITIFDNGAAPKVHDQSRGIVLELDEDKMTASLVRQYTHPDRLLSTSQGNVQVLPNGNVFVGWGSEPVFSEFTRDGEMLFDGNLSPGSESYRTFRFEWEGRPEDKPSVAAEPGLVGMVTVYASWNGATGIVAWQVLAGSKPDRLKPVGPRVPWDGFETAITVYNPGSYIAVRAEHSPD